jgi:hypothetical protein
MFSYSLISSGHGTRTENTAALLLRAGLLMFPRDRYLACPLARWLLPSNRKHCSHCCVLERVSRAVAKQCFEQIRHNMKRQDRAPRDSFSWNSDSLKDYLKISFAT